MRARGIYKLATVKYLKAQAIELPYDVSYEKFSNYLFTNVSILFIKIVE